MSFNNGKENSIKENKSIAISDGAYAAVVVGYYVSMKAPFDDPEGEKYTAIRFALQIEDDEGENRIIQTADMKTVFAEKSNLFKQISGWCKATSPTDLWDRLEKAGFMNEKDELCYDNFLGKPVQLMITMKASKKDASKLFPEIQFTTPKKGQAATPKIEAGKLIPIWKPSFVNAEDEVDATCLEGFEWKTFEKKEDKENDEKLDRKSFTRVSTPEAPKNVPENAAIGQAPAETPKNDTPNTSPAQASQRLIIRKRNKPAPAQSEVVNAVDFNTELSDANPDMPF